jgi:hypothetical protein
MHFEDMNLEFYFLFENIWLNLPSLFKDFILYKKQIEEKIPSWVDQGYRKDELKYLSYIWNKL